MLGTVMLLIILCAFLHLVLDTTTSGDNNFDFVISYFYKKVHPQNVFSTLVNSSRENIISFVVLLRLQLYRIAIIAGVIVTV